MLRKTVLILDPDPFLADSLAERLERRAYRALSVASTVIAKHHLGRLRPDAVVVDARAPGFEGFLECVRQRVPAARIFLLSRRAQDLAGDRPLVLDPDNGLDYLVAVSSSIIETVPEAAGPVLIASALEGTRLALKEMIERRGYPVYAAESGRGALEFVARAPEARVAFLDADLSDQGGLACCREALDRQPHPEVILAGVDPRSDFARYARVQGVFDAICPPFEPSRVLGALEVALGHASYRAERSLWGQPIPRFAQMRGSAAYGRGGKRK